MVNYLAVIGPNGLLNKVPEVTLAFWIIKIMSTTVGETGADYLAVHVGLGTTITGAIMASLLLVALLVQLRMRRYVPWTYWLTVVLVSVVGTQITDALTDRLGVSLYVSTAVFAATLGTTFAIWYATERTLSIHTIITYAPRVVLLGGHPFHLRAWYGSRRPRDRGPRPWLQPWRHRV